MTCTKMYVFFVILSIVTFLASIIVGGIFMSDGYDELDNDVVNTTWIQEENYFEITPASWAFSIWFFIYAWQAIFFLYCVLSIFQRFSLKKVPIAVFPFYIINNLCGVAWTIVAERNMYWAGVGTIAGLPFTLYVCLFISIRSLYRSKCRYFLYTYMVNNAFAIYAGWTTVATLLYVGIALIHGSPQMGQQMTGTIMLAVLMAELAVFCTLELTLLDKFMRHIWGHYIGLIVGVVGSLINNWDPKNHNSIMTVAITGFITSAFLVKIVKLLTCKRPDDPVDEETTTEKKYIEN